MTDVRYDVTPTATDALLESVSGLLRSYNRSKNAAFFTKRELPEHAARHLHVFAYDASDQLIGGLIGESAFAWLHIEIVAVSEQSRHKGVGRRLMQLAEDEGRASGCRYVFLDTMSYQAPDFYQKLGYSVAGRIEDWDSHGHTKIFFTKSLSQTTP